jgi:hypothetical protein
MAQAHLLPVRHAVGYHTSLPTLTDAIAIVRQPWWPSTPVDRSPTNADRRAIPCALLNRLTETLCYAA